MRRIYDGNILVDWDIPPDAAVCPPDETARCKWGWQQDSGGRWYRDLAPGQRLQDPPRLELIKSNYYGPVPFFEFRSENVNFDNNRAMGLVPIVVRITLMQLPVSQDPFQPEIAAERVSVTAT